MMKFEIGYDKKQELYDNYLSEISNINFTFREIDIISCILHNRGEKKIAALLLIAPRTVSTHVHNIMLKLGYSSRESIIDFLEKSGKLSLIRQYYLCLLIENSFEEYLVKIARTINRTGITYTIDQPNINSIKKSDIKRIRHHLRLANINFVKEDLAEEPLYTLNILNNNSTHDDKPNSIFLLFKSDLNHNALNDSNYIDPSEAEEYYFSVLNLLNQMINDPELDEIILNIKKDFHAISSSWERRNSVTHLPAAAIKNHIPNKFIINGASIGIILILLFAIPWAIKQTFGSSKTSEKIIVNADLPRPENHSFLERTSIINDIVSKFSKKNGVQTVALVGIGGSGKTTVARQYARISDASIIWEINTETRDSIITSFQELAYAICQSTEEQQEINQIQQLQDIDAREQRVFLFLNNKIKNYPNWLIIYDQVNNFQDIVKYLPHDETIWENGKIIITTNNTNITHSSYIPNENIIYIPELNDEEKLQLFTNIISKNDNTSEQFNTDYISCLKHIPPFPLDVSIAAHYIKETHIPCEQYLQ